MPINTIDDVLSAMDGIIQRAWDENSRLGYFAALYRRVTRAVRNGVSNGSFQNGPLMERLDVVFASRYLDALAAYQSGTKLSRGWKVAFDACNDDSRLILQHLLAGMNAHINLDLGIASAQVSPGDQLPQLKTDFDQINDLLAAQVGAVETEMSTLSPLIKNLSTFGLSSETTMINFNIGLARDTAWFIAQRLASEPSFLHDVTIDGLDLAASLEGRAILYPPFKTEEIAQILAAEVKDVRNVIDILAADVTQSSTAGGSQ
ncbi:MAG: DUF5995 family protein [Candidatus Korobacteraceae bacterium]|jgi:hypothetical protein